MISEGNLDAALSFLYKIKNVKNEELNNLLTFKEIQILYYKNELDKLKDQMKLMINKTSQDHIYYNDLLSIKHDVLLFADDINFKNYSLAMLKIFQNKRTEAINILESILEIDNEEISNKIKFD